MSLANLLELNQQRMKKTGMSQERLFEQIDPLCTQIAFFRQYPDLFIDYIKGENSIFKFYSYQRVFLRSVMRHRYVYATFPRGYSKSFLSVMALMLRCILYPGSHLFVTTGGK